MIAASEEMPTSTPRVAMMWLLGNVDKVPTFHTFPRAGN